jgi:galactonate dehydratase
MARLQRSALMATEVSARTTWKVVSVCSGGETGYGEYSDSGDDAAADDALRSLLGNLAGADLDEAIEAVDGEAIPAAPAARPDATQLVRRTVLGGVSTALWELRCRLHGISLAEAFGGQQTETLPVYANLNRAVTTRTPDEFADRAQRAVSAGFRCVKLAPFDGLRAPDRAHAGLAALHAVRERVGPDIGVMLDVHHVLRPGELRRIAVQLSTLRLRWIEDAAPLDDLATLRWLRDSVGAPLAGGEFAATPAEVQPALSGGALDYLMPDVKHAGGPARLARLVKLARQAGVRVSLHNPAGVVATAVSAQLAAALAPEGPFEIMVGEGAGEQARPGVREGLLHVGPVRR